ncbi:hypothetical protein OROGR_003734 [Orobanche gracilis]
MKMDSNAPATYLELESHDESYLLKVCRRWFVAVGGSSPSVQSRLEVRNLGFRCGWRCVASFVASSFWR